MSEENALLKQRVDQHDHILDDHESRIRLGENTMYKIVGGFMVLNIVVTIAMHFWK